MEDTNVYMECKIRKLEEENHQSSRITEPIAWWRNELGCTNKGAVYCKLKS